MRKKPIQQRARVLVDSLIDAAGEVVARDGLEALTTVRVAARAGVSVGSLYQYFDNKNMLVAALMDRVNSDLIAAVDRVAPLNVGADPQAFAAGDTAVIIDPPRKGCDENFLAQLFAYGPRAVVYVSCDPATQMRDLKAFLAAGYDALPDLAVSSRELSDGISVLQSHVS